MTQVSLPEINALSGQGLALRRCQMARINSQHRPRRIGLHRNRPPRSFADTYGPDQRRLTPAPRRLWFFNLIQRRCGKCELAGALAAHWYKVLYANLKLQSGRRTTRAVRLDMYIMRLSGEKWREREREREDPGHRNCLHNYHRPQQPACICFRGCETLTKV